MIMGQTRRWFYAKSAPAKAEITLMVKKPTALRVTAPLSLRPPVAPGERVLVLVVTVKLEARELAELMTEEREEREEERSVEGPGVVVVVGKEDVEDEEDMEEDMEDNMEDKSDGPIEEVGGRSDVTVGRDGIEVGLFKQVSELPALTVITGVALASPLKSASTITTLVPAAIVTLSQVYEIPVTLVKAARIPPLSVLLWKDYKKCQKSRPRTRLDVLTRLNGAKMSL